MKRFMLFFPYLVLAGVVAVVAASNVAWRRPAITTVPAAAKAICAPCGMAVDPGDALAADIDGRTVYFCNPGCRRRFLAGERGPSAAATSSGERIVDVVCQMEVNAAWGIQSVHNGQIYQFCAEKCKQRFDADPEHFLHARCLVCRQRLTDPRSFPATYLERTYHLCSEEHRTQFKQDPAAFFMHSMWGIPSWLYYASIALVLLVSFGVFEWISRYAGSPTVDSTGHRPTFPRFNRDAISGEGERLLGGEVMQRHASGALTLPVLHAVSTPRVVATAAGTADRMDLMKVAWIAAAFRSRPFRFILRMITVVFFVLIVAAGLWGNQNPAQNIAPILTWTIWWGLLIVLILFAGKAWCYVCPWDALAEWSEKLSLWRKIDDGLSLGWKWPKVIRNISIATILFVGLTWIELGFGVTMRPRVTAYLAIAMLLMAVGSALLFDRKSFCRYGCLVGRVSGLYALFASVEVRPRNPRTCTACRGKECVTGSETAYGCPTFLYPGKLATNTYCIQCMECVQACPEHNLSVNLRPWGADLVVDGKPRTDEAYLALLMLAITGFHGLTMTPVWQQMIDAIRTAGGVGRILGFSAGMGILMLAPVAAYAALVALSVCLGRGRARQTLRYRDYFIRYAYALLPIALFYHIAHNSEHLLMEGPKALAILSDPLGWGWNVLGTAGWVIPPMISLDKLWIIQVFLVLVGHVYSLWIAQRTSLRLFGDARAAFRSQLPMLGAMICFSVFSLWLLKQPMEMRTSAM